MLSFEKYHGCGNDFVIVDEADIGTESGADHLSDLSRNICHRQLGVGADGLIIVRRNPLRMDIINSDGSVAPMCGNGIRCFALYAMKHGLVPEGTIGAENFDLQQAACGAENFLLPQAVCEFDVDTLAGVMRVRVSTEGDSFTAEINMGRPDFSARAAGVEGGGEFMKREVALDPKIAGMPVSAVKLSSLFLGTYHTVVWLDENDIVADSQNAGSSDGVTRTETSVGTSGIGAVDGVNQVKASGEAEHANIASDADVDFGDSHSLYNDPNIDIVGRALESHPVFTQRTNVNFARVVDRNTVEMITWERGAGLTAACGTGASSVVALGIREGRFGEGAACGEGKISAPQTEVRVILPYGELFIRQAENGDVFMRGPAEHVFDGVYLGG